MIILDSYTKSIATEKQIVKFQVYGKKYEERHRINELILKAKADLKEKEAKGLKRWAKFMASNPKKSTSSITSTSTLSATSVTISVTIPTASSTTATADNAIIINDPTSNDSPVTGASSILSDPVLLQSKNKAERETPAQNKIKKVIDVLKDRIVQLSHLKESGLSNSDNVKQLKADRKSFREIELKLKNLIPDNVRQRKRRSEKSALIKQLSSESEQARIKLQKFGTDPSWITRHDHSNSNCWGRG